MTNIKSIGVIGAGQMGNGIAHVAALSGFEVVLLDISAELTEKGLAMIFHPARKFRSAFRSARYTAQVPAVTANARPRRRAGFERARLRGIGAPAG